MRQISTNDWGILKGKRIPRWPGKIDDKRGIKIEISSWVGTSIGARHTYVKVSEEDNMWWCEHEKAWVKIYTDTQSSGYSLEANVFTEQEALKIAKYFIELIAGKECKNHYLLSSGMNESITRKLKEILPFLTDFTDTESVPKKLKVPTRGDC